MAAEEEEEFLWELLDEDWEHEEDPNDETEEVAVAGWWNGFLGNMLLFK